MPVLAPFHDDERDLLLGYVDQQRAVLHLTAYGLTDEQARMPAAGPSALTVGGLIKHVAKMEQNWMDTILERERSATADEEYVANFIMRGDETLDEVIAAAVATGDETTRVIRGIDDLGQRVPVPRGVPWFRDDLDAWSVRWVLMYIATEIARHAGHADIVREAIDGATAFPLMAAAEGWPATPWMQPWEGHS
jgi:Protein of unknown function (DUF664)